MTDDALFELLAALGGITDMANGQPVETTLRVSLVAMRLAEAMGLPAAEARVAAYAGLLRFIGCTAYSYEEGKTMGGDDIATARLYAPVDFGSLSELGKTTLFDLAKEAPLGERVSIVAAALGSASRMRSEYVVSQCEVARRLGERLCLPPGVDAALVAMHERYDGAGGPVGLSGEAIPRAARIVHVAHQVVIQAGYRGLTLVPAVLTKRRGGQLDPALVDACGAAWDAIGKDLDKPASVWDEAMHRARGFAPEDQPLPSLETIAHAFGDYADMKSPVFLGHSGAVSSIAERAAVRLELAKTEVAFVRTAGFLLDVGRVAVPNGVWEKPGALTPSEWEQVRLHAYHGERVLLRHPSLAAFARAVGEHHERRDASGYHRGLEGSALSLTSQLLATADVHTALLAARPHRAAHSRSQARALLEELAAEGKLDRRAVGAVLAASGHPSQPPPEDPRLTDREREVLRLIARGLTNKEIGNALDISARTVQQHATNIYDKLGFRSRAGAALYATEQGLL
jgi:HD-GYP domain-containing protein (c-di-GMP phosphodiesterase class II)